VNVYLNEEIVETMRLLRDNRWINSAYIGITDTQFNKIEITGLSGALDNIQFKNAPTIPTPNIIWLISLGLISYFRKNISSLLFFVRK